MKRPTGVTIIALFLFLYGVIMAITALALITHPDIGERFAHNSWMFPVRTGAEILGIVSLISSIFSIGVSVGIWFLWAPARWALLLGTGIPLAKMLRGAIVALTINPKFASHYGEAFWVQAIVYSLVVSYLLRADTRRAFEEPGDRVYRVPGEYIDGMDSKRLASVDVGRELKDFRER